MYSSKGGINVPRFSISQSRQLENALNSLSDAIVEAAAKAKKIESSADIRVIENGDTVLLELDNRGQNLVAKRFETFYNSADDKLFVYEGYVHIKIDGEDKKIVPTINGVPIFLPTSSGFEGLNRDIPAHFSQPITGTDVWRVYLKIDLAQPQEGDKVSLILHNFTKDGHPSLTKPADLYFEISEVFLSDGVHYVNQKWASDIQISDNVDAAYTACKFRVTDITDYPENGWPSNSEFKVRIKSEKIEGRYPYGMGENTLYDVYLEENMIENGSEIYIYAKVMLDEYGVVQEYDTAITIEFSNYWLPSGSCIQRIPIAQINLIPFEQENGQAIYIDIQNYCPLIEITKPSSCDFEIEDASDDPNQLKVQIRNGKIEGQYPIGMSEKGNYQIALDSSKNWHVIYAAITIDDYVVASLQNAVSFLVSDRYEVDTEEVAYRLIGEVTVSTRENGSRYISYIKNICYIPEVGDVANCPFMITDASAYDENGVNPIEAKVKIENGKVNGRYPLGMAQGTDFIVDLADYFSNWVLVYIYVEVLVDENGLIYDYDEAISIRVSPRYLSSGSQIQRTLIGRVEVVWNGSNPVLVPSKIYNACPIVGVKPISSCPFELEDATEPTEPSDIKILVKTTTVDGNYPDGMSNEYRYLYSLNPNDGTWYAFYLITKLDYKGDYSIQYEGDCSILASTKYLKSNAYYQYKLIGEVTLVYDEDSQIRVGAIQNYCDELTPPGLEDCPFAVVDATINGGTGIVVRNGKVDGRFPSGMGETTMYYLELPPSEWYAVYCGMSIDSDGRILDGEGSIWIEATNEGYKESTDDTYYVLLAEVNIGYDEDSVAEITYIRNSCVIPESPYQSGLAGGKCLFEVLDWSDPSGLKVRVSNGKVKGIYPAGMSPTTDYVFNVPTESNFYAVYFVAYLNEEFNIYDNSGSRYFVLTDRYVESTSEELYTLVAEITVSTDSANGRYISFIQNFCNEPATRIIPTCPFQIFKASNLTPTIQIRNGTVRGRYPSGMGAGTKYQLTLGTSNWYAIYLVIVVGPDGNPSTGDNSVTFGAYDTYQTSTETEKYFLIGEVTICIDSDNRRYPCYIVNSCDTPQFLGYGSGSGGVNSCPFQISDSSYPGESGALNLQVKISQGMVNNRWPDGMGLNYPDYNLPISGNCYVWMVLGYKTDDVELLEESTAISIEVSTDLKTNTETIQYELIGTVVVSSGGPAGGSYISNITSVCGRIEAKPCSLAWSNAGTGGTGDTGGSGSGSS